MPGDENAGRLGGRRSRRERETQRVDGLARRRRRVQIALNGTATAGTRCAIGRWDKADWQRVSRDNRGLLHAYRPLMDSLCHLGEPEQHTVATIRLHDAHLDKPAQRTDR